MQISVQSEDFDLAQVLKGFGKAPNTGATVNFTGLIHDNTDTLKHIKLEH